MSGIAIGAVIVVTLLIGTYALRLSRTTSDFYVASRTVSPLWNASAIGGEYLSAASFLGVAGLILTYGADMLWFPVGYTAGYLVLLVLIAAPLRRSGAYTLPDFAEARLESRAVRRIASVLVVTIGWLYLLPQFVGAGLAVRLATGAPGWVGGLLVAVVVMATVATGGMRSITFVQAFQYWLKLTALAVPVLFLLLAWQADGSPRPGPGAPTFPDRTRVELAEDLRFVVEDPVRVLVRGSVDGTTYDGDAVTLSAGRHLAARGAALTFPAGAAVPRAESIAGGGGADWLRPLHGAGDRGHPLYSTYSLILALFFGTMGLPHVLVRFYTNPDGHAARRTTLIVLGLLGAFYMFPTVYGALARVYIPELLLTGDTDTAVLLLPERLVGGTGGQLLAALLTAGAFAAFLSTSSGLTVSVAGVLSQDVLPGAGHSVRAFRLAAAIAVLVPLLLSQALRSVAIADVVGLAFAVAASSFCPLLVLGIWWRGLTSTGASAGLIAGGGLATAAVAATVAGVDREGWAGALLAQPAAWSVPVAFAVMVVVSLRTPHRVAPHVGRTMVRLHAPEALPLGERGGPFVAARRPLGDPGP